MPGIMKDVRYVMADRAMVAITVGAIALLDHSGDGATGKPAHLTTPPEPPEPPERKEPLTAAFRSVPAEHTGSDTSNWSCTSAKTSKDSATRLCATVASKHQAGR